MSPVLPFDIIALIIDTVGENKDTNLLKELALVSHSFHQICSKHLFATIELHDIIPNSYAASSKKGFVKLLEKRPDIVKYIRKLTCRVERDDRLLSPVLPNLLRTVSGLNSLTITGVTTLDWKVLDSSLTSVFLHLMHLPTINHIELSCIDNFPLSSLIPAVNLLRLDILHLRCGDPREEDGSNEFVVQSEIPKIREFHTTDSHLITTKLLHAKRQDGQPAFNFMSLRRLSISSIWSENEGNIRYLLQNAKLLEKLYLFFGPRALGLAGLHCNLLPSARTLKVLDLAMFLNDGPFMELCEELEAIARHNWLESLSLELKIYGNETEFFIGSAFQKVEEILVKPGWPELRQVSFQVWFKSGFFVEGLQVQSLNSIPNKYLSRLPKLQSVAFNFSTYDVK